jgi:hypothetical protein
MCSTACWHTGMQVVTLEAAQQMRDSGQFLVHQEVLGHHYGITSAAVRKLQAMGKLPLLDLDRVQDVEQLRASGFQVRRPGPCLSHVAFTTSSQLLADCFLKSARWVQHKNQQVDPATHLTGSMLSTRPPPGLLPLPAAPLSRGAASAHHNRDPGQPPTAVRA